MGRGDSRMTARFVSMASARWADEPGGRGAIQVGDHRAVALRGYAGEIGGGSA